MMQIFIFALILVSASSQEVKVVSTSDDLGNENETIFIDLQRKNEDIKLIAQVRFHVIEGIVHLNNNSLKHNAVNHIHMKLLIAIVEDGVQNEAEMKPVQLRVLVEEKTGDNGENLLIVEEEFLRVEGFDVIQVEVQQIVFESQRRKPITRVAIAASKIHQKPVKEDHHVMFADHTLRPRLSDDHHYGDKHDHNCEEHDSPSVDDVSMEKNAEGNHKHHHRHHHHRHHHHRHHRHHSKVKCWYRHLSWRSKIALFSVGFLSVIAVVLFCLVCSKKRQARRRRLEVSAPIDDTVAVDMDDVKKVESKDDKLDFHFEINDSPVAVSDKKPLIE